MSKHNLFPPDPKLSFVCDQKRDKMVEAGYETSCCNEDLCNNNSTDDRYYAKFRLPPENQKSDIGDAKSFRINLGFVARRSLSLVQINLHLGSYKVFILGSSN